MTIRGPTKEEYEAAKMRELEKAWKAGMWPALFDAVRDCQINGSALPEWAAVAVLNLIIDKHHDGTGSAHAWGSIKGTFGMNYTHFVRWLTLDNSLRFRGMDDRPRRGRGRPPANDPEWMAYKEALAETAHRLEKRRRAATEAQIEESYDLVRKSRANGEGRFTFDVLDSM